MMLLKDTIEMTLLNGFKCLNIRENRDGVMLIYCLLIRMACHL